MKDSRIVAGILLLFAVQAVILISYFVIVGGR